MRRRVMSIVLCAMICAAVIVIEVPVDVSAFESIMFVDDDNTSGIEDGTWTYPYNTIQEGVDAAKSGDGVYVFSGMYNERISISKSLHIMGEDRDTTIIDAGGGPGDIVNISANWVNITGFTITNSGSSWYDAGIELNNVYNCVIDNNDISSIFSHGIFLSHSSNITISRNKIHNTVYGIEVWYSSYITVSENDLYDNDNGVNSWYSSNNDFLDNIAHDNSKHGFFFSGTPYHNNTIIGNNVFDNDYDGINFEDQTGRDNIYFWNNSIISNMVHNNDGAGISIFGEGTNNYIIENIIYENGYLGTIYHWGYGGIQLSSPQNNSIIGNTLHNNACGIFIRADLTISPKGNTIANNNFHDNIYGIYGFLHYDYLPTKDNTIANNIFFQNDYGIYLDYFNENNVVGNMLDSNNIYGIWISNSSYNTIYYNNIINNTNQAIDDNPSNNFWHHPDLLEGNYWSDYTGVDDGSGVGKHAIAGDGMGDTLIPHPDIDYDFYPLVRPWTPSIIPSIDIDPDTLNLKSKGRWITCYINLPEVYDVNDIDLSTILLEDTIPADWGDVQNNTLMVKFDRSEVEDMLSPGNYNLKVNGELMDGRAFEGYSDEIRVIDPP